MYNKFDQRARGLGGYMRDLITTIALVDPYSVPTLIMNSRQRNGSIPRSKFVSIYSQLLQGIPIAIISPNEDPRQFISSLLILDVNRYYLEAELRAIPRDVCFGPLK